jgi:hypothetical protein
MKRFDRPQNGSVAKATVSGAGGYMIPMTATDNREPDVRKDLYARRYSGPTLSGESR